MSFESKIESVRSIIDQHNKAVAPDGSGGIDFDKFLASLKGIGGTTDAALSQCTWEDIEDCGKVGETKTVPRLLARQIASVFRKVEKDKSPRIITDKRAQRMSVRELFEAYDPRENNPVAARLRTLSEGHPCVVFNTDNTVNVTASTNVLQEIKDYGPLDPPLFVGEDGVPHKVEAVGYRPDDLVNENPLLPGNPLRGANESCHWTHRSWKGISHKTRVLFYLALETEELRIREVGDIHSAMDLVVGKDAATAEAMLVSRYLRAKLRLDELEKKGRVPTLKIPRKAKKAVRKNNPFGRNRTY